MSHVLKLLENYHIAKTVKAGIEADVQKAGDALEVFPRGPTGMTPDHVKFSPEYRAAKSTFDTHFKRLQNFNKTFVKTFKKEIAADRIQKRMQRTGQQVS